MNQLHLQNFRLASAFYSAITVRVETWPFLVTSFAETAYESEFTIHDSTLSADLMTPESSLQSLWFVSWDQVSASRLHLDLKAHDSTWAPKFKNRL